MWPNRFVGTNSWFSTYFWHRLSNQWGGKGNPRCCRTSCCFWTAMLLRTPYYLRTNDREIWLSQGYFYVCRGTSLGPDSNPNGSPEGHSPSSCYAAIMPAHIPLAVAGLYMCVQVVVSAASSCSPNPWQKMRGNKHNPAQPSTPLSIKNRIRLVKSMIPATGLLKRQSNMQGWYINHLSTLR